MKERCTRRERVIKCFGLLTGDVIFKYCQYLVGILLGQTYLLEPNDMTFLVSVFSMGPTKKELLDLFLRRSENCLCGNEMAEFVS